MKKLNKLQFKKDKFFESKITISDLMMIFIFIFSALTTISTNIFRLYQSVSIVFLFLFIIPVIYKKRNSDKFFRILLEFFILFILSFVQLIYDKSVYGIGAILNLLQIICCFFFFTEYGISYIASRIISFIYLFICVFIATKAPDYGRIHASGVASGNTSLVNPNFVGYMICAMSIFIICNLITHPLNNRVLNFSSIIFIFLLNLRTITFLENRSSLLSLFAFASLLIFSKKSISKSFAFLLFITLLFLTFAIPYIYVFMFKNNISFSSFAGISKRAFTGREIIWMNFVRNFNSPLDWLAGLGSRYTIEGASDIHNSFLTIIKNNGIISLVILVIFFFSLIASFQKRIDKDHYVYFYGFITIMIIGFFESILIDSQVYIILMMLLYKSIPNKGDVL